MELGKKERTIIDEKDLEIVISLISLLVEEMSGDSARDLLNMLILLETKTDLLALYESKLLQANEEKKRGLMLLKEILDAENKIRSTDELLAVCRRSGWTEISERDNVLLSNFLVRTGSIELLAFVKALEKNYLSLGRFDASYAIAIYERLVLEIF